MDTPSKIPQRVVLSPKQLAASKGVRVNTVYDWMKLDGFPCERAGTRGWVCIPMDAFEEWRRKSPAAENLRSI